ncbi:MAG: hypothetical protein HQL70_09655 [Magnetococcales bacterium]|nr:hypothetical protein [Magnetococcales bacterium]
MATAIATCKVTANIMANLTKASDQGSQAAIGVTGPVAITFTNGTGANQANNAFVDQRTTDDTGEELDFSGSLTNEFGETLTATKVKALMITAAAANTIDIEVGGAAANGLSAFFGDATDQLVIKPGGTIMLVAPNADGYAVTAGTGDLLKVAAASAGNVTYDIVALLVA